MNVVDLLLDQFQTQGLNFTFLTTTLFYNLHRFTLQFIFFTPYWQNGLDFWNSCHKNLLFELNFRLNPPPPLAFGYESQLQMRIPSRSPLPLQQQQQQQHPRIPYRSDSCRTSPLRVRTPPTRILQENRITKLDSLGRHHTHGENSNRVTINYIIVVKWRSK